MDKLQGFVESQVELVKALAYIKAAAIREYYRHDGHLDDSDLDLWRQIKEIQKQIEDIIA